MLTVKQLQDIMSKFNDSVYSFKTPAQLKEKVIANAIKSYATDCRVEDVVGIMDTTILGSGKTGFLISKKALYGSNFDLSPIDYRNKTKKVPLDGIRSVTTVPNRPSFISVEYRDGKKFTVYGGIYKDAIIKFLNGVIKALGPQTPKEFYAAGQSADADNALKYYLRAAEMGHADAQYKCGEIYYNGSGVTNDYEKALMWYKKAAAQGHHAAMNKLAFGENVAKSTADNNKKEASAEHSKAKPEPQTAAELYSAGLAAYRKNDYQTALQYCLQAAKMGHTEAQVACGWLYYRGLGAAKDPAKALMWYEKAALQNHPDAMYKCAQLYFNSDATEKNLETALFWAAKANEQNMSKTAQLCGQISAELANAKPHPQTAEELYSAGQTAKQKKDFTAALEYFLKAAEMEHADAQFNCAEIYNTAGNVNEDKAKALMWYEKAGAQGNPIAQYNCGFMYFFGIVDAPDAAAARPWFEKAAAQGHEEARQALAVLYR